MNTAKESVLTDVQITFEYLGQPRILNKNPRVQQAVRDGSMSVAQARLEPWTIRLTVKENGEASRKTFTLDVDDSTAIAQAKNYIKGNGTTKFEAFLKHEAAKRSDTIGELAAEWQTLNMPDATQRSRDTDARENLETFLLSALEFWADKTPATITAGVMNQFATWRRNKCKANKRGTGDRSIDLELGALSSLCDWAVSTEKVDKNPFATRPKYQRREDVSHCHEFMPESDEQWHDVLRWLFTHTYNRTQEYQPKARKSGSKLSWAMQDAQYTLRLRIIGGWLAFTGLTGLRPEEPATLYRFHEVTEAPGNPAKLSPGTVFPLLDGGKKLRVYRNKNGQNPFVKIHPALADFLEHWNAWLDTTFGRSQIARPWFPNPTTPTESIFTDGDFTPLIRRLTDACAAVGAPRLKPKGFGRAFYVRVRRSQGADDSEIASELGQTTNGQLIRTIYGNPEDLAGGAIFDWLPKLSTKDSPLSTDLPAWHLLTINTATNIVSIQK